MTVYYIQTNLICVMILLGVHALTHNKKGFNPTSQMAFTSLITSTVVLCISDAAAWMCNGGKGVGAAFFVELFNIINYISITWVSYAWINYVNVCLKGLDYTRSKRILNSIPFVIIVILGVTNPVTHFLFTIDEQNVYQRGPGIILHWIITWGYLVYALAIIGSAIRHVNTNAEKAKLRLMTIFIIMPAIGAVLQMLFYGVTATGVGITLSILIIAYGNVQEQVSTDVLTGLNNRRSLENFIDNNVTQTGAWFSILMCDIDKFKSINDTYGHLMGDLALRRMAGVLKSAVGRKDDNAKLFLCRYGGDEFVICGVNVIDDVTIRELIEMINTDVAKLSDDYPDEVIFGISIGLAEGRCTSFADVDNLLHSADDAMYKQKQAKKVGR